MFFPGRSTEIYRSKRFRSIVPASLRLLVTATILLYKVAIPCALAQEPSERIQSLTKSLESEPGTALIDSINNLGYSTFPGNLLASTSALVSAFNAAQTLGYTEGEARSAENLGLTFYLSGAYDSSTYYNLHAIALYKKLGNEFQAAKVLCGQGYQMKRRNLNEAFTYYRSGLSVLRKIAPREELSAVFNNYGVLHEMNNDLDCAIYFYSAFLELSRELRDSLGIPFALNTLAFAHLLKGDTVTAGPLLTESHGNWRRRISSQKLR